MVCGPALCGSKIPEEFTTEDTEGRREGRGGMGFGEWDWWIFSVVFCGLCGEKDSEGFTTEDTEGRRGGAGREVIG
jgi:hypothetical protein